MLNNGPCVIIKWKKYWRLQSCYRPVVSCSIDSALYSPRYRYDIHLENASNILAMLLGDARRAVGWREISSITLRTASTAARASLPSVEQQVSSSETSALPSATSTEIVTRHRQFWLQFEWPFIHMHLAWPRKTRRRSREMLICSMLLAHFFRVKTPLRSSAAMKIFEL